jgi:hypothetical protein
MPVQHVLLHTYIHEGNIQGAGQPFTSSLNVWSKAYCRKGWGGQSDTSPSHHHPTVQFIPADPWIFESKTTEQLFSSSVFTSSPAYIVQARTQPKSSRRNVKNCFCLAFMLYSTKLLSAYNIKYMYCIVYIVLVQLRRLILHIFV